MKMIILAVSVFAIACSDPDPKTGNNANNLNNANNINNSNNTMNFTACTEHRECIVRAAGCCEPCDVWTLENSTSINGDQNTAYSDEQCGTTGMMCPECATQLNPNLLATCENANCTLLDVANDPISECVDDVDCVVRTNTCCECSAVSPETVIAIAADKAGTIRDWLCDEGNCPDCIPDYTGYEAVCNAGRCEVLQALE